jgi:hypothetical protein
LPAPMVALGSAPPAPFFFPPIFFIFTFACCSLP